MKYVVYFTRGNYSDYGVSNDMLMGDLDPIPIIDTIVAKESGGKWKNYQSMKDDRIEFSELPYGAKMSEIHANRENYDEAVSALEDKKRLVGLAIRPRLEQSGFVCVQSTEVWID